jgi:hypothetical protein
MWSFVGSKKNKQWVWIAMDAKSMQIIAFHVGGRSQESAKKPAEINRNQPLYVLKNSVNTDGAVKLMSLIKKSPLRFRTYDSLETPRLSVHEARKQVVASIGVIANLLHIEREGALIDNARSALIAGIAMASSKITWLQLEYDLCLIHRIT